MRIRRTLQISTAVSTGSVVLLAAAVTALQIMDTHHVATTMQMHAAARKISLMRGLPAELSGASRQRAALQWQIQYAELVPILMTFPSVDGKTRSLKSRILDENAAVGTLFDNLSNVSQDASAIESAVIIAAQLDVRTTSMVSDILAMNDIMTVRFFSQKQWLRVTTVVFFTILAGAIAGLQHVLYRRVIRPIVQLEKSSVVLTSGKLDQPIEIVGNDEITSLARSFEAMRVSLRDRLRDLAAAKTLIKEENEKLAQRVEERTSELKAANLELDSFAYAVAHDLRAPLRAISGFSRALMEDLGEQLSGDARVDLDHINLASLRMSELIDGLLVLSRSTRAELRHDTIDLSAMANGILTELAHADPQREIACEIEPGLTARGDARMIDTVLRNLLENAWKYTLHTPQPSIRFYAEPGNHFFCVADNGAGFDMAHAGKLFQPFQRLHRQEEFPGTGIGLATVSRIVLRHGGVIKAEGLPGKGATFCFSLPPADTTKKELS